MCIILFAEPLYASLPRYGHYINTEHRMLPESKRPCNCGDFYARVDGTKLGPWRSWSEAEIALRVSAGAGVDLA